MVGKILFNMRKHIRVTLYTLETTWNGIKRSSVYIGHSLSFWNTCSMSGGMIDKWGPLSWSTRKRKTVKNLRHK